MLMSGSQICDRWSGADCSTWRWSWSSPVAATTTIIIITAPLFQCHHLFLVTIHVMQLTALVRLLRLEVATSLNYLGNSCSPVPTPPSALFMFISPKTLPMSISDPNNFTQFKRKKFYENHIFSSIYLRRLYRVLYKCHMTLYPSDVIIRNVFTRLVIRSNYFVFWDPKCS